MVSLFGRHRRLQFNLPVRCVLLTLSLALPVLSLVPVPKFSPDLENEYPTEEPFKIFRRLEAMWKLHLQQLRFGSHCAEGCDCASGWQRVFKKGDVLNAPQRRGERKRCRQPAEESDEMPRVPRKASRAHLSGCTADNASEITDCAHNPTAPTLQPHQNDDTSSINSKRHEIVSRNRLSDQTTEPFIISFDAQLPLGFCCVTLTKPHPDSLVCEIVSVDPRGEAKKKNRLVQKGTYGKLADVHNLCLYKPIS